MAGNLGRRWIAGKRMVIGDKIKAIVLSLQLKVLTHGTEKVANMKFARRLYTRKNPQIKLPILKTQKLITKNANYFIKNNGIRDECQ